MVLAKALLPCSSQLLGLGTCRQRASARQEGVQAEAPHCGTPEMHLGQEALQPRITERRLRFGRFCKRKTFLVHPRRLVPAGKFRSGHARGPSQTSTLYMPHLHDTQAWDATQLLLAFMFRSFAQKHGLQQCLPKRLTWTTLRLPGLLFHLQPAPQQHAHNRHHEAHLLPTL